MKLVPLDLAMSTLTIPSNIRFRKIRSKQYMIFIIPAHPVCEFNDFPSRNTLSQKALEIVKTLVGNVIFFLGRFIVMIWHKIKRLRLVKPLSVSSNSIVSYCMFID